MKSNRKNLYPFRQIAIRTRCLHRLNPQELMVRKGFWVDAEKREGSLSRFSIILQKKFLVFPPLFLILAVSVAKNYQFQSRIFAYSTKMWNDRKW